MLNPDLTKLKPDLKTQKLDLKLKKTRFTRVPGGMEGTETAVSKRKAWSEPPIIFQITIKESFTRVPRANFFCGKKRGGEKTQFFAISFTSQECITLT